MVLEPMGRDAGWIALMSGIAGGADVILIPAIPWSIEGVTQKILERRQHGKPFSIVVVAEGTPSPSRERRCAAKVRRESRAGPAGGTAS